MCLQQVARARQRISARNVISTSGLGCEGLGNAPPTVAGAGPPVLQTPSYNQRPIRHPDEASPGAGAAWDQQRGTDGRRTVFEGLKALPDTPTRPSVTGVSGELAARAQEVSHCTHRASFSADTTSL